MAALWCAASRSKRPESVVLHVTWRQRSHDLPARRPAPRGLLNRGMCLREHLDGGGVLAAVAQRIGGFAPDGIKASRAGWSALRPQAEGQRAGVLNVRSQIAVAGP